MKAIAKRPRAVVPPKVLPLAKRVVYLWGAGATQAEISYLGARPINLLMRSSEELGEGVSSRVMERVGNIIRIDSDLGVDIEKLISLLASSGMAKYVKSAENVRAAYFEEICRNLVEAKISDQPSLALGLFQMHKRPRFRESVEILTGMITTNHDGLLQVASQEIFGGVNLGFPFSSTDYIPLGDDLAPPILQLHGSFSWELDTPIKVLRLRDNSRYSADAVWLPPSILKEAKNYPFNKMMGHAYELLSKKCDVLRIVGCSLTQNDWNILSLIFGAQRHKENFGGSAFQIELITSHSRGKEIRDDCSYLRNVKPIGDLPEGRLADYKEKDHRDLPADMKNSFAYWLGQKIEHHYRNGELGAESLEPQMSAIAGGL